MAIVDEAPGVVASPERLAAWLVCAQPGAEFVYATRCGLPPASEGAKAAREAYEQGFVTLFQRRIRGSKAANYVAKRTSRALGIPPAPKRVLADRDGPHVDDEIRVMNAVLNLLRRAAKFARPCPTDFALARRAGVDRDDVGRVMDLAQSMNLIRVQRVPAPTLRQVTIVGTGHRTGLAA